MPTVADLERQLFEIEHPKPPAKVRPRDAFYRATQSRYRAAVNEALRNGWSFRALARRADCTVQHLTECYHGRRNPGGWMFDALPRQGQLADVHEKLRILKGDGEANVA